jgi:hypothetical protein
MNPIYTLWNGSTVDLSRIVYVSKSKYDKKYNGLKSRCICLITLDCCINPIEISIEAETTGEEDDFFDGVEALINQLKNYKETQNGTTN